MAGDPVFLELVKVLGASSATMTAARPPIPYTDSTGSAAAVSGSLSHLWAPVAAVCGHAS